jgi:hypothetical protein
MLVVFTADLCQYSYMYARIVSDDGLLDSIYTYTAHGTPLTDSHPPELRLKTCRCTKPFA